MVSATPFCLPTTEELPVLLVFLLFHLAHFDYLSYLSGPKGIGFLTLRKGQKNRQGKKICWLCCKGCFR